VSWVEGLQLAALLSVLHLVVFCGTWAFFAQAHAREWFPTYRVAEGKAPTDKLLGKATKKVPFSQIGFFAFTLFAIYPIWSAMGGAFTLDWPAWHEPLWQIPVLILAQDTLFYWSHRGLHHKWWFRRVHSIHHRFRPVRGQSAEYAHTVEDFANVMAFMLPAALLACHPATFAVWVVIRVFETVYAHSGYAFDAIASRHAYHHLNATGGCFGSFFGFWDRVMGTDKQWREWRKSQPHR